MLFSIVFLEAPHNNAAPPILTRTRSPSHFSLTPLPHLRCIHSRLPLSISESPA